MHAAMLVHFLGTATGWAATLICLILFIKNRKKLTLELTLFVAALTSMVGGVAIDHYGRVAGIDVGYVTLLVSGLLGTNLFIIIAVPLVHHIFGQKFSGRARTAFIAYNVAVVGCSIAYLTLFRSRFLLVSLQISLYLVLAYCLIFGILSIRDTGAKEVRGFLTAIFVTALLFFPLLALDSFMGESPLIPYNLTLSIFLIVLSLECTAFAVLFLDQPAFLKGNHLTKHCVETLKLSAREKEIVESLLKGHTNKEISEELFISFKTVENHLYNIYQKAGVKNRTQLVSLIHTNAES